MLEPLSASRDCVMRRIAIGGHCSLQIVRRDVPAHPFSLPTPFSVVLVSQTLNVAAPTSLPELHFLGAERILNPMRQALNTNLARWSLQRSVRQNLEEVLETEFPSPQEAAESSAEAYNVDCAICYNYRSETEAVPECACDGCGKPFHGSCLSEWLRGLPTTQQSFNRLFGVRLPWLRKCTQPVRHVCQGKARVCTGECPYCSRPIAVAMASTRA